MQTVLLTGCAGFVGQKTAELLLEKGYSVIGIDNLNDYYSIQLKKHRLNQLMNKQNFMFYNLDIENKDALESVFSNNHIKAVINLAARAGVRYSIVNPYIYFSTNVIGTMNILEQMKDHKVKKMVLASSSSLYAGHHLPFKEDEPVNKPISQYAASKKAAEVLAYTYHHLYSIDISILRYFTVYGPAGRPDMSYFKFIKSIDEGKPINIFGDGKQSRDFTYIDDIADGTVKALRNVNYEIINLGGGKKPIIINDMVGLIEGYLNKKAIIEYLPFNGADMMETGADIGKAKNLLNWEPGIDFEEGIKKCVEWYIQNRDWLWNIDVVD